MELSNVNWSLRVSDACKGDENAVKFIYTKTASYCKKEIRKFSISSKQEDVLMNQVYQALFEALPGIVSDPNCLPVLLRQKCISTCCEFLEKGDAATLEEAVPGQESMTGLYSRTSASEADRQMAQAFFGENGTMNLPDDLILSYKDQMLCCVSGKEQAALIMWQEGSSEAEIGEYLGVTPQEAAVRLDVGMRKINRNLTRMKNKGVTVYTMTAGAFFVWLVYALNQIPVAPLNADWTSAVEKYIKCLCTDGNRSASRISCGDDKEKKTAGFLASTAGKVTVGVVIAGAVAAAAIGGYAAYNHFQNRNDFAYTGSSESGETDTEKITPTSAPTEAGKTDTEKLTPSPKPTEDAEQVCGSWDWYLNPSIEADDIYYLRDDLRYSYLESLYWLGNDCYRQFTSDRAVIRSRDTYNLITMDGQKLLNVDGKYVYGINEVYELFNPVSGEFAVADPNVEVSQDETTEEESLFHVYFSYNQATLVTTGGDSMATPGNIVYWDNGQIREIYDDVEDSYYQNGITEYPDKPYPVRDGLPSNAENLEYAGDLYGAVFSAKGPYAVCRNGTLTTDFVYDELGSCSDGIMAACQNGKWGYIDGEGNVVIPFAYDSSWIMNVDVMGCNATREYAYAASDGFINLCKNGEWELRTVTGELVIAPGEFDQIRPVVDGKCWVQRDGKWGVISVFADSYADVSDDSSGKENLEFTFERIYDNNEYGAVYACDETGKLVWSYKTVGFTTAQLDWTEGLGEISTGYILVAGDQLICLDKATGCVVWSSDYPSGGSPVWCFDSSDNIYVIGYFGNRLSIYTKNGDMLWSGEVGDDSCYWPWQIMLKGAEDNIHIDFESKTDGIDIENPVK